MKYLRRNRKSPSHRKKNHLYLNREMAGKLFRPIRKKEAPRIPFRVRKTAKMRMREPIRIRERETVAQDLRRTPKRRAAQRLTKELKRMLRSCRWQRGISQNSRCLRSRSWLSGQYHRGNPPIQMMTQQSSLHPQRKRRSSEATAYRRSVYPEGAQIIPSNQARYRRSKMKIRRWLTRRSWKARTGAAAARQSILLSARQR